MGLHATRVGPSFKIKPKPKPKPKRGTNDALCSDMRVKMLNINVYFIIYNAFGVASAVSFRKCKIPPSENIQHYKSVC